jgi:arylsulfatase A-like enzyme
MQSKQDHIATLLTALFMAVPAASFAAATPPPKPNIIVVVADDLGWGHVGWQNPKVRTPHLDRLANAGVKLNRHYVAPVCSPTRVALMTGRYWSRFGCNSPLPSEPDSKARAMPPGTATIATALKTAGYRTALVGKWHLGASLSSGPEKFGFDHFYGLRVGGMTPLTHKWLGLGESVLWRNGQGIEEEGHVTDLLAREAVQWIGDPPNKKPFFLYLSFTSPHVPLQEPQAWMNLYKESAPDVAHQLYWASISHLDEAVGRVMAEVERIGQRDNTLVVFLSDNGAPGQPNLMQVKAGQEAYLKVMLPGDNPPLRGKKGDVYEGGIRTPAFAFWPDRLQPGTRDAAMHVTDWMPTLCALAGHRPEQDLKWDGQNVWPVITGKDSGNTTRPFYTKGDNESALHQGDWKLIQRKSGNELYHITGDEGETTNQALENPELVQRLLKLLEAEAANDNDARPSPEK